MIAAALLLATLAGDVPVVMHAEPPKQSPVAAIVAGTVTVKVHVADDGSVSSAEVLSGPTPLADLSRKAALEWRFEPSSGRSQVLTFEFAPPGIREATAHWEITRFDPVTMRVQYFRSSIRRLDRNGGQVALRLCSLHGNVMDVLLVPISYGLPAGNRAGDPRPGRVYDAVRDRFPNAPTRAGGGCVVHSETHAEVYSCARCRHARESFFRQHPELAEFE